MHATFLLGVAASLATVSSAHSVLSSLSIDGKSQGDGTCIRMPLNGDTATDPINGLTSNAMACGVDGDKPVYFTCPAPAGSKLTFEWRETPDGSAPGAIDSSHKGPCAVYLKPVADTATATASGDGWFKIWEDGYDESTNQFCTEKLIANSGRLDVTLPAGLPTGYYLARAELLALQNVEQAVSDPQFYVGCAQIHVSGGATSGKLSVPSDQSVTIPGHVHAGEPSVSFDIYTHPLALPLPIPGPRVYAVPEPTAQLTVTQGASSSGAPANVKGAVPAVCLVMNGNWCGVEVPDYHDEEGCWASAENCFVQLDSCYGNAPPTGNRGCQAWEGRCETIQGECSAGNFSGPPNKGQKISVDTSASRRWAARMRRGLRRWSL